MLGAPSSKGAVFNSKPRALTCFICGRGYGTSSLEIHIKNCEKKFLAMEAQKPKKERRPLPTRPDVAVATGGGGTASAEAMHAYNDAAFHAYNDQALIKCDNCGRTFLPDSLKHHRNACSVDKPFKPLPGFGDNPAQPKENAGATQQQPRRGSDSTEKLRRLSQSSTGSRGSLPRPAAAPKADGTDKPWQKRTAPAATSSKQGAGDTHALGGGMNGTATAQSSSSSTFPETPNQDGSHNVSYTREHIESAIELDKRTVADPFCALRAIIQDLASRGHGDPTQLHRAVDEALSASAANQTTR